MVRIGRSPVAEPGTSGLELVGRPDQALEAALEVPAHANVIA